MNKNHRPLVTTVALGAFCTTALVTSGLSPATAHKGYDDYDELRVKVCKQVRGNYYDNYEDFRFRAWTDKERKSFSLEDDECKRLRLDFDNNRFWLREYDGEDYDVEFRVRGDYDRTNERDDRVKVWIDDRYDEPSITIKVINHDDYDDNDDDY